MAGNPDQQEDNVDEQYQEEGEEEVGRGRAGGQTAWGLTLTWKNLSEWAFIERFREP